MAKQVNIGFKCGPLSIGGFKDSLGNPTDIDRTQTIPVFGVSDPSKVEIRNIGGEDFAVPIAVGASIQVFCDVDVDLGDGIKPTRFIADETIDVPPGEAATATIDLGPVTPI